MRILKFISYSFGNFANTIAYQIFGNWINFYYDELHYVGQVLMAFVPPNAKIAWHW